MSERRGSRWARRAGFLTGLCLAAVAVLAWRMEPGAGSLGTDVIVASAPTGELGVSRPGPLVSATGLHPGPESRAPSGTVTVRNDTAVTLSVRVQALPSVPDLDSLLWVRVEADGRSLFRGPVGTLRDGSPRAFVLASGQEADIHVSAWLPGSVVTGYEGRVANVDVTFLSTAVTA